MNAGFVKGLHGFLERDGSEAVRQQEKGPPPICIPPERCSKSWLGWNSISDVCNPITPPNHSPKLSSPDIVTAVANNYERKKSFPSEFFCFLFLG